jgi:FkbM family methyltransferase
MIEKLKAAVRRFLRPPIHASGIKIPYEVLGTEYGGWPIIKAPTSYNTLVYSVGIGEDISFDLAAISKFQCRVEAFDPTPKSQKWVSMQKLPNGFRFHAIGLAATDGEATFYPPANKDHTSFSAVAGEGQMPEMAIKAAVKRLSSLVAHLDGLEPDILKMDIEGFEYSVLDDLATTDIRPGQLLIEFHHRMYGIPDAMTRASFEKLLQIGYQCFYVSSSGHEYGFVHENLLKRIGISNF